MICSEGEQADNKNDKVNTEITDFFILTSILLSIPDYFNFASLTGNQYLRVSMYGVEIQAIFSDKRGNTFKVDEADFVPSSL